MIMVKQFGWFQLVLKYSLNVDLTKDRDRLNALPISDVGLGNIWRLLAVSLFYEKIEKNEHANRKNIE
jgi:hypothetical protein